MKLLISLAMCSLLLTACASNYHYQSETQPNQFLGKNISLVQKQWGSADQTLHTRTGTSYYLYTTSSGRNAFYATRTNFALLQDDAEFPARGQLGLECSAIFKTDKNGVITGTSHAGTNCGGEWAPNN